ncbi:hypothetical protein CMV00_01910 [Elizabethkingia anophelis]|nr:hypothetical protein [Elizabethkingia anophelis]
MKELFNDSSLLFCTWFLVILCFYMGIIVQRRKNKLLKYFTEVKHRDDFQTSIKTGVIEEELMNDLEPGSEYLIRKIYVLRFYSKILLYIFLFLVVMIMRILIFK